MESLVLCPEELCLGPAASRVQVGVDTSAEFSIWTNEAVEKGARFLPWKGTVRSDKLAVYNKLPNFDVSPNHSKDYSDSFQIKYGFILD